MSLQSIKSLPNDPETKYCVHCRQELPISEFRVRSHMVRGEKRYYRHSLCRECFRKQNAIYKQRARAKQPKSKMQLRAEEVYKNTGNAKRLFVGAYMRGQRDMINLISNYIEDEELLTKIKKEIE